MWGDTLEIKFIKVPPLRILHSSGELDISAKKGLEKWGTGLWYFSTSGHLANNNQPWLSTEYSRMVKRSNIAQAVPALAHNYWPGQVTGQSALGNCDQVLHIPCTPCTPCILHAHSLHIPCMPPLQCWWKYWWCTQPAAGSHKSEQRGQLSHHIDGAAKVMVGALPLCIV